MFSAVGIDVHVRVKCQRYIFFNSILTPQFNCTVIAYHHFIVLIVIRIMPTHNAQGMLIVITMFLTKSNDY